MSRDLEYEANNIGYDWQYPQEEGGGIKCKNYIICETVLPMWWYECKGHYECTSCCVMRFGVLNSIENVECPICFEIKIGISQPNCEHTLCIECFKRCYYGEEIEGPRFPYSDEIWNEYDEDQDNEKWDIEYPLIKTWNQECNQIENNKILQYENESHLRLCPLCRK